MNVSSLIKMAYLGRAMSGIQALHAYEVRWWLEDRGRHIDCGLNIGLHSFGTAAKPICSSWLMSVDRTL